MSRKTSEIGVRIYKLAAELFPIHRSITGDGVRQTLRVIKRRLPNLKVFEVPSGTKCFDWKVPLEWNIKDAYLLGPNGKKLIDFKKNHLHVVGYSIPVKKKLSLEELQGHLYSLKDQPGAIPYVSSFYEKRWGFCLTHKQRSALRPGVYTAYIDSTLRPGRLTYGELLVPGKSKDEILLSTNICHPFCANNGLSGPAVTTFLANWILSLKGRRYTYRIVFIPQTIGSIYYISRHLRHLKHYVKAGFVINCVGDDRIYSYLESRAGDTLADRIAKHVLKHIYPKFKAYSFLDRGGDERQYCAPGVDLGVVSVMRSKYGTYPEYRTSNDNLHLITPKGLSGGYDVLRICLLCAEYNETNRANILCEPQLGKRSLYPTLSMKHDNRGGRLVRDLIAYSDGLMDLIEIADRLDVPAWTLIEKVKELKQMGMLR